MTLLPSSASGRRLVWIAGAVAGLVALSLAVTLLSDSSPELLPEGSPERAVQDFLLAIEARDHPAAWALLSPELQRQCAVGDFGRSIGYRELSYRVRLESVTQDAAGAEVAVRITERFNAQPIPSESTHTQHFFLVEVEGEWRLREAGWPFYGCPSGPAAPITPAPAAPTSPAPADSTAPTPDEEAVRP